jgi:hypothetical protein
MLPRKIDVDTLGAALGAWLCARAARAQVALTIDGKVLHGAWSGDDTQVRLLSAMLHGEGVVVAQVRVPEDTNEFTQVEELVGRLPDIPGRPVVTCDTVHAQHATAELLVKAGMDYIFTIKRNQPTLERKIFELVLPFLQEAPHH